MSFGGSDDEKREIQEKIQKLSETVKFIDCSIEDDTVYAYVVDTERSYLRNDLKSLRVSDQLIDQISTQYKRVTVIRNIWVDEEQRGRGQGSQLLVRTIEQSKIDRAEAVVLVSNKKELNTFDLDDWFKRHQFHPIGIANNNTVFIREISQR
jgi:ribosomal protein S18 acetylase RimI-like enzyme